MVYAEEYATDAQAGALMREAGVSLASVTEEVLAFRWLDLHGRDEAGGGDAQPSDSPAAAPSPAHAPVAHAAAGRARGPAPATAGSPGSALQGGSAGTQ